MSAPCLLLAANRGVHKQIHRILSRSWHHYNNPPQRRNLRRFCFQKHRFIKHSINISNLGIRHLDIPFLDGRPPSSEILQCTLNTMLEGIDNGAVAVHCRGGVG
jgi:protein tyrosine phosphatase